MFKKILFIVNPASGVDEPILSHIYKSLYQKPIHWDIKVTKKAEDVTLFAKHGIRQKYDLIAVYGGDGTVSTVAKILFKKSVPLAIIPGGTANIIAKELQIPTNAIQALELITKKNPTIKKVDMAVSQRQPILLGFNVGLFAHTIKNTPRQSKNQLGQLAYGLTAFSNISNLKAAVYDIECDRKKMKEEGVALMIANFSNVGIANLAFVPNASVYDGKLDIILYKKADIESIMAWAKSTITQTKPVGSLTHIQAKKVSVSVSPNQTTMCDDKLIKTKKISLTISPKALQVLVPHA